MYLATEPSELGERFARTIWLSEKIKLESGNVRSLKKPFIIKKKSVV